MKRSEHFGKLAGALAAAVLTFPVITKNRSGVSYNAVTGEEEPYSYATLDHILAAVRTPLAKNGLVIAQGPLMVDLDIDDTTTVRTEVMETMLLHSSGEWIGNQVRILMPDGSENPHDYGTAQSYAKRYGVTSLLGISPEDDTDGTGVSKETATGEAKPARSRKRSKPASDKQVKLILGLLKEAGMTEGALCSRMEVASVATLSADQVDKAIELIGHVSGSSASAPPSSDESIERKRIALEYALKDEETLRSMQFIRDNLQTRPDQAAEEWLGFNAKEQGVLWLAPTKGGWFTTAERDALKKAVADFNRNKAASTKAPKN